LRAVRDIYCKTMFHSKIVTLKALAAVVWSFLMGVAQLPGVAAAGYTRVSAYAAVPLGAAVLGAVGACVALLVLSWVKNKCVGGAKSLVYPLYRLVVTVLVTVTFQVLLHVSRVVPILVGAIRTRVLDPAPVHGPSTPHQFELNQKLDLLVPVMTALLFLAYSAVVTGLTDYVVFWVCLRAMVYRCDPVPIDNLSVLLKGSPKEFGVRTARLEYLGKMKSDTTEAAKLLTVPKEKESALYAINAMARGGLPQLASSSSDGAILKKIHPIALVLLSSTGSARLAGFAHAVMHLGVARLLTALHVV